MLPLCPFSFETIQRIVPTLHANAFKDHTKFSLDWNLFIGFGHISTWDCISVRPGYLLFPYVFFFSLKCIIMTHIQKTLSLNLCELGVHIIFIVQISIYTSRQNSLYWNNVFETLIDVQRTNQKIKYPMPTNTLDWIEPMVLPSIFSQCFKIGTELKR